MTLNPFPLSSYLSHSNSISVVCLHPHPFSKVLHIVGKLIFLKTNLNLSPASLKACNNSSLHYTWRLYSSELGPCGHSAMPADGSSSVLQLHHLECIGPWWTHARRRETENTHRGSPLPPRWSAQLQVGREGPSFIYWEEEEDIVSGNTALTDETMCLPDSGDLMPTAGSLSVSSAESCHIW